MRQRAVFRRNLYQTVLKAFVGEVLRILWVHDADTVHDKAIGIHIGSHRAKGHGPCAIGSASHVLTTSKLDVDLDFLCRIVPILERYRPVVVGAGLC